MFGFWLPKVFWGWRGGSQTSPALPRGGFPPLSPFLDPNIDARSWVPEPHLQVPRWSLKLPLILKFFIYFRNVAKKWKWKFFSTFVEGHCWVGQRGMKGNHWGQKKNWDPLSPRTLLQGQLCGDKAAGRSCPGCAWLPGTFRQEKSSVKHKTWCNMGGGDALLSERQFEGPSNNP